MGGISSGECRVTCYAIPVIPARKDTNNQANDKTIRRFSAMCLLCHVNENVDGFSAGCRTKVRFIRHLD